MKWRARDCNLSLNDDGGKQNSRGTRARSERRQLTISESLLNGNPLNAAEFVTSSVLTEAGLGPVIPVPPVAPPVREIPSHSSSWATTVA